MVQVTEASSPEDTLEPSESSYEVTPSSTIASSGQRRPAYLYDEAIADDPRPNLNTHPNPVYNQPSDNSSRPPETQQPHTKDQPSSRIEDVQSAIAKNIMDLLSTWNKLGRGTVVEPSTETKESIHHSNIQAPKAPGASTPKVSEDGNGPSPLGSKYTTGNCVISHVNFDTLLRLIHDDRKSEAFYCSKLEAIEHALQAHITKSQDEKARADLLEARLQEAQELCDKIQEEKKGFQSEAQEANRRLEDFTKKASTLKIQPGEMEKPEAMDVDTKEIRNELGYLHAALDTTNVTLEKLRASVTRLHAGSGDSTKRQGGGEPAIEPVSGQPNVAVGLHLLGFLEGQLKQTIMERLQLNDTKKRTEEQAVLLRTEIAQSEQRRQMLADKVSQLVSRSADELSRNRDLQKDLDKERETVVRLRRRLSHAKDIVHRAKARISKLERRLQRAKSEGYATVREGLAQNQMKS